MINSLKKISLIFGVLICFLVIVLSLRTNNHAISKAPVIRVSNFLQQITTTNVVEILNFTQQ